LSCWLISASACRRFGGIFDYEKKKERLAWVRSELENPDIWKNPQQAQELGKERSQLENTLESLDHLEKSRQENLELLEVVKAENDEEVFHLVTDEVEKLKKAVENLEFKRMFSHPMDPNNAYLDINSGSGGTEAQDWAEMLLRMYLRWCDRRGFKTIIIEVSAGEVAGIKSATVHVEGDYAFGWLRTETGVHRLVRKSPFDSGNRRHTSFASVFVSPEISDDIQIEINPADIRTDTYRASGAGGQHVNKTDSAIRLTHLPTGIVVQCQSDRSQHKNRSSAMKQLKAKLYEMEEQKKKSELQALEEGKSAISWGSQIRSYILDAARVKDLRTSVETTDTQSVLDGDLDPFIEASLKEGI
jgi:peptide chain release factor 2